MKKTYLMLLALLLTAFSVSAQEWQEQKTTLSNLSALRAEEEVLSYYTLKENDPIVKMGSDTEITAGPMIFVPGEKLKGCKIVSVFVSIGEVGEVVMTLLGMEAPVGSDQYKSIIRQPVPLEPATEIQYYNLKLPEKDQKIVDGTKNYLFGYIATFKGKMMVKTDPETNPFVSNVNFLIQDENKKLSLSPVDGNSWAANWVLAVKFVRETGVEGVFVHDMVLYPENGKIIVEGVQNPSVQVFDMQGQEVRNENLPKGNYLVHIQANGKSVSTKLQVK